MVRVSVEAVSKRYGHVEALRDVSLDFAAGKLTAICMYTASVGYEMQIASVTALVLMVPGAVLLLLLERVLKAEYLVYLGQV